MNVAKPIISSSSCFHFFGCCASQLSTAITKCWEKQVDGGRTYFGSRFPRLQSMVPGLCGFQTCDEADPHSGDHMLEQSSSPHGRLVVVTEEENSHRGTGLGRDGVPQVTPPWLAPFSWPHLPTPHSAKKSELPHDTVTAEKPSSWSSRDPLDPNHSRHVHAQKGNRWTLWQIYF